MRARSGVGRAIHLGSTVANLQDDESTRVTFRGLNDPDAFVAKVTIDLDRDEIGAGTCAKVNTSMQPGPRA